MATIVERPMSALSDAPALPQPRRRPSVVEVIDVDLLDETPSNPSTRPRPRPVGRTQPEEILLIDSDDEEPVAGGSSNPRQRSVRTRLVSPPLRVSREASDIPPVPRVPRRYSGLTSLPIARRPGSHPSPPVVRPIDQPFDFEANIPRPSEAAGSSTLSAHPNRHRRVPHVNLQPEPPSHHVPSLGLGGALISMNRVRADRREQQRREQQLQQAARGGHGFFHGAGNAFRRMYTAVTSGFADEEEDNFPAMQMFFAPDMRGHDPGEHLHGLAIQEIYFRNRDRQRQRQQQEVEYRSEFTHPGKPESGFTFDFAPPEPSTVESKPPPIVIDLEASDTDLAAVPGSSSSIASPRSPPTSASILLVCARCLDPLVLGGGLVGEDGRKKKVWALRCGHMIDGKCLDAIGAPDPEGDVKQPEDAAIVFEPEPERHIRSRPDGKGKGKAPAEEEPPLAPTDNSIRSRLRSRGTVPHPPPTLPVALTAPSAAATTSRLGKRKRPSSPAKPRIEATHLWKCPAASCGRTHASVKIDAAWVPEPDNVAESVKGKGKSKAVWGDVEASTGGRGAIAVFV